MRFPDSILNCVVFISAGDEKLPTFRGTGFIVGIVEPRTKKAFWHLVTAKHVADHLKAGPFMIGVNLKADEKVLVRASEYKWWYHPVEPTLVDAAVGVFATKQVSEYKLEYVPEEIFATDECIATNNIGVGDELGIVGLFTKFYGTTRLWAIVRSGNIAMMPGDRIPIDGFGPMEVYLAEGRSIGGLSGSPVFVRDTLNMSVADSKGGQRKLLGQGSIYFLGLMHGHWEVPLNFSPAERAEAVNMGISIIVPAKKILQILYHPELVALRSRFADDILQEQGRP